MTTKYLVAATLAFASVTVAANVGLDVGKAEACGFKVVTIRRGAHYRDIHPNTPKAAAHPAAPVQARSKPVPVRAGPSPAALGHRVASGPENPTPPDNNTGSNDNTTPTAAGGDTGDTGASDTDKSATGDMDKRAGSDTDTGTGDEGAGSDTSGGDTGDNSATPPAATKPTKAPHSFTKEVFFKTASSDLNGRSKRALKKDAAWLKAHPDAHVTIEGHTDVRGAPEFNMALSERRANAVKDALVEMGVDASQLDVQGMGADSPKYKSNSKNRRAALKVQQ